MHRKSAKRRGSYHNYPSSGSSWQGFVRDGALLGMELVLGVWQIVFSREHVILSPYMIFYNVILAFPYERGVVQSLSL
jgi:hypothetical protein